MDLAALLSHLVQQDLYKVGKALADLGDLEGNVKRGPAVRESDLGERGEAEEEICPVYPKTNMARFVLSWSSQGKIFIESQVVSVEPLEGQGAVHRRYP